MAVGGVRKKGFFVLGIFVFAFLVGWCRPAESVVDLKKLLVSEGKDAKNQNYSVSQIDIVSYASRLSQRLYDLRVRPEDKVDVKEIWKRLRGLSNKIQDIAVELLFLKGTNHLNYNHLLFFREKLLRISKEILHIDKSISYTIRRLMEERRGWLKEKETLLKWKDTIKGSDAQGIEWRAYKNAKSIIDRALSLFDKKLDPLLGIEERVAELQGKLHELSAETDQMAQEIKGNIFERNAPVLFSSAYFSRMGQDLWKRTWDEIKSFVLQQGEHVVGNVWILVEVVFFTLLLTFLVSRSGRNLKESSRWRIFTQKPFAASLFFCLSMVQMWERPLPPGWQPLFQFFIIVTVILLSKEIFRDSWKWHVLYRFAVLILIVALFRMIVIPKPLLRIVVFGVALAGVVFCLWQSCHKQHKEEAPLLVWSLRLSAVVLAVALVADVVGYASFSMYFLNAFLLSVFMALELWMVYIMTLGFIELVLTWIPFAPIRKNTEVLLSRIRPIVLVVFFVSFVASIMVIWQVYTTGQDAIESILSFGVTVGGVNITLNLLLSAAVVLYGSLLISWGVQALLLQEVLPRRGISRGVQLSISRLVHYGIVFIGFLFTLRTLGFGLTNITIIGGALGVGIGFGLQAIVNNFASGLILLFERPIKIGDTIEVDNEMAVVKRLGLRSTVVQTLDNAEIVIPNSDLVTQRVTNWTLANRLVRVRIPVGVAYGTNIEKVREILLACAKENPKVLTHPEPQALFIGFGDSALNFELRAWISEFMDSTGEVQSQLNAAINEKFREAGIEIPFPQTDLHVRSIDEEAVRPFVGKEEEKEEKKAMARMGKQDVEETHS